MQVYAWDLPESEDSPAACRRGSLDGVDPEADGDVPESLHSLLVWFVVVLHECKISTHHSTKKSKELDPTECLCTRGRVRCVCVRVCERERE